MLSVTNIMPVLVLLSVVEVRMQQCMIRNQNEMHKFNKVKNACKYADNNKQFLATFSWQDLFPANSLTFSKIPDISLTAVKFSNISRFSRQSAYWNLSGIIKYYQEPSGTVRIPSGTVWTCQDRLIIANNYKTAFSTCHLEHCASIDCNF